MTKGPTINAKSKMMRRASAVEDSLADRHKEYRVKRENAQCRKLRSDFKNTELKVTEMAKSIVRTEDVGSRLYSQRKLPPPPPPGAAPPRPPKSKPPPMP